MVESPGTRGPQEPREEQQSSSSGAAASNKKPRRFLCTRCDTRFARLENLQRHERIHTQEKPFACQLCDHRFTRSDLLIRHERLSHQKDAPPRRQGSRATRKSGRKSTSTGDVQASAVKASPISQPAYASFGGHQHPSPLAAGTTAPLAPVHRPRIETSHDFPLATLSMAAEHVALQIPYDAPLPTQSQAIPTSSNIGFQRNNTLSRLRAKPSLDGQVLNSELDNVLDQLASFLDNGALSSYHVSSLINSEQPMPFFSPESAPALNDVSHNKDIPSTPRFAQTPLRRMRPVLFRGISLDDRTDILMRLNEFSSVIHAEFKLPTRLALSRYIAGYINGFHEHLPFLHIPTMSIQNCSIELILAMAAVGAQYCFEGERGMDLFHASQEIAIERIRRRDARLVAFHRRMDAEMASPTGVEDNASSRCSNHLQSESGPLGLPSEPQSPSQITGDRGDLMQTAQALLVLMAMATWAKHKEILREALALQSILATLVRDAGLASDSVAVDDSWEEWARLESAKRTKFIVYCFFNLHCIVYNIPSLILNSEIKLTLPCSATEFKAPTPARWQEARRRYIAQKTNFQGALNQLFSRGGNTIIETNSSLGNYVLIHAIIQHIFFLRQVSRGRFDGNYEMSPEDITAVEQALRNWQLGWKRNPESSLDPQDPNGPVAFNSTALLRLAYIRLNIGIGPCWALDTRDPVRIARAFRDSPAIKRTPRLVRAVLHSAHALSIPVKIGIRLVAQTQTFSWSIQHSLCSLECAFLLSKWLEALSRPNPDPPVSEDERRIATLVKMMLDETEVTVQSDLPLEPPAMLKQLSAGVLRVWANVFKGAKTWAIVDVIASSLNIYADMLDAR
ncbi:hypothetical protein AJ80_03068 [Polytolypa hystricis UAMH7299]|uniref:C2H2-type domain-containing protein n=1 Tax=Polytolypa hystricis (strain UAMH7299) TaxID=1447883 RepID=A0A2B7YJY4_POLH7|nr:hypothetical protein AJ80_03068 [Polytolypa hystricis UAMH7299]